VTAAAPSIFLATPCYGGLAHASYTRSLLALRPACAARGIGLHVELGGGEALVARGRAAMMAAFLASAATRLLFVGNDVAFAPEAVFRLLDSGHDVVGAALPDEPSPARSEPDPLGFRRVDTLDAGFLLVSRRAAQRMVDAHPELRAKLGDLHAARAASATMMFDAFVDPQSGRYLAEADAFCHRWRALGGEVWADTRGGVRRDGSPVPAGS